MHYDLYVPGTPPILYRSVELERSPAAGDYLTINEEPFCVRVTHVPNDPDDSIEVQFVS